MPTKAFANVCKYADNATFEQYITSHGITSRNANHHRIVRKLYMYGDIEKFKRYINRFEFSPSKIFEVFCQHCDFVAAQWLINALNLTSEDVERDCEYSIAPVLKSGFIRFKKWIIKFFNVGVDFVLYNVFPLIIMRGITFNNLSWMFTRFNMTKEDILERPGVHIFDYADASLIQRTIDWFYMDGDDAMSFIDRFPDYKDILHPHDVLIKSATKVT